MGTCLMCHRKIPNGQKFCENCKQKRKNKADESYLDSLLSSVGGKKAVGATEQAVSQAQPGGFRQTAVPASRKNANPAPDNQKGTSYGFLEDTVDEKSTQDMDEMLTDILNDMDEAGSAEQPESTIGEEDIENIFDEAEAYAALLSKENTGNKNQDGTDGASKDAELIDFEWGASSGADSQEPDDNMMESPDDMSEDYADDGYNEEFDDIILNEGIQGENTGLDTAENAFSDFDPLDEEIAAEDDKPKNKKESWIKRLFKRLFSNTNDEVTPEMIEAERKKKAKQEEIEKQKKAEKKKQEEEKLAELLAEKERKKAEADAERNRKLALAIEKKNAAKEKEKKKKEQALAIAEYELEHGKINKAGATILFVIFAVLTIVIIIGTNIYSYNLSIKNAQEDFDLQKYNEAYYEVYGLKIQDEDIELYDRIMTVMYVNKQLNSYEYYMTSKNREKALDSLLKGLQRYDKYLQLATRLGITDDLNYVKGEILEQLKSEFDLTEEEASKMIKIDDSVDYSEYLYGLLGSYPELDNNK